jgi:glutamyl-tRNA reductase
MLEIRKSAVSFNETDMMELERIMLDGDEKEAMQFLKKKVYDRILHAQTGRLKSHLDSDGDTVADFHSKNK